MHSRQPPLRDRFAGCFLGLAVADALGAQFEGTSAAEMWRKCRSLDAVLAAVAPGELCYTDDTQMSIGVAETLIALGCIESAELGKRLAMNYRPQRGYGWGARRV